MTNFKEGGCTFRLLSQKNSRKKAHFSVFREEKGPKWAQIWNLLALTLIFSKFPQCYSIKVCRLGLIWYFKGLLKTEFVTLSYRRVGGPVSTNLSLFKFVIIGSGGRGSGLRCTMSFSLPFFFIEGVPYLNCLE